MVVRAETQAWKSSHGGCSCSSVPTGWSDLRRGGKRWSYWSEHHVLCVPLRGKLTNVGTSTPKCAYRTAKVISWNSVGPQGLPGGKLFSVSPATINFGNVAVDTESASRTATITNASAAAQYVPFFAANDTGSDSFISDFGSNGTGSCPMPTIGKTGITTGGGLIMPPGGSCTLSFVYSPSGDTTDTATYYLEVNGQTIVINLTGTGTGPGGTPNFVASPTSLAFGDVPVGSTSAPRTMSFTNIGSGGGLIGLFSAFTVPSPFQAESDFCSGLTSPTSGLYLNPGQSCTIANVTFSPTADGPASESVTFSEGLLTTDYSVSVSGTGTG